MNCIGESKKVETPGLISLASSMAFIRNDSGCSGSMFLSKN